jgi:hypothetical protein
MVNLCGHDSCPSGRRPPLAAFLPLLADLGRGMCADAMVPERDGRTEPRVYFQTKYRELQEQCIELRNRYYLIECAWCKTRIGWKRKAPSVPGDTSHGICRLWAADIVRQLQAMKRASGS